MCFGNGGLGIKTLKHLAKTMSLVKRHALRNNASDDVQQVWSDTSTCHVRTDLLIITNTSISTASKSLKRNHVNKSDEPFGRITMSGC